MNSATSAIFSPARAFDQRSFQSGGGGMVGTADDFMTFLESLRTGGAQILAYTTGRGNPLGSPLGPVIKITATASTAKSLHEIIDFDASPVLRDEETIQACGQRLLEILQ